LYHFGVPLLDLKFGAVPTMGRPEFHRAPPFSFADSSEFSKLDFIKDILLEWAKYSYGLS